MEHRGTRLDPRKVRFGRMTTAVALVTLSMFITPQAISRAIFSYERAPGIIISGLIGAAALVITLGGVWLLRRNVANFRLTRR